MEKEINENIIEIEGKKYKFIEAEKSICCRSCDLRKDKKCHLLHRMCISDNRKDKKEGYFKRIEDYQDNPQEFKLGDEVIDIFTRQRGKILQIGTNDGGNFPIYVNFNEVEGYTLDGRYYSDDKYPRLLHYRNDYDYSIIDFNNLPKSKRQEPKRWRAEKGRLYYFVKFNARAWVFSGENKDGYDHVDNGYYNSGNYFRTEAEAKIIAQKLNTYFKQLIQEEHEHEKN